MILVQDTAQMCRVMKQGLDRPQQLSQPGARKLFFSSSRMRPPLLRILSHARGYLRVLSPRLASARRLCCAFALAAAMADSGSPRKREEEEEDDVVCLDPSFFVDRRCASIVSSRFCGLCVSLVAN
jgi:hypothetical protein